MAYGNDARIISLQDINGIAREPGESQYPHLWRNLQGLWVPSASYGGISTLRDFSLYRRHLTLNGSMNQADWEPGPLGYSLDFDGTDDYAETGAIITAAPLTMMCWVKPDSVSGNGIVMFAGDKAAGIWRAFYLFVGSSGAGSMNTVQDNSFTSAGTSAGEIGTSRWVHICGTTESSTDRKFYLDGKLMATGTTSMTPTGIDSFFIGCDYSQASPGNFYNGKIDDIRIYNRALTQAEIQQIAWQRASPLTRRNNFKMFAFKAPTGAALVTPTAIGLNVSLPAPTVTGKALVSAGVQTVFVSLPAPTVTGKALISADVLTVGVSLPAPTVTGKALVSPDAQVVNVTLPSPTVTVGGAVTVQAGVLTIYASLPAPTVTGKALVSPSAQVVNVSLPSATVATGTIVATNVITLNVTLPAPTVTGKALVSVGAQTISVVVAAPSITTGETPSQLLEYGGEALKRILKHHFEKKAPKEEKQKKKLKKQQKQAVPETKTETEITVASQTLPELNNITARISRVNQEMEAVRDLQAQIAKIKESEEKIKFFENLRLVESKVAELDRQRQVLFERALKEREEEIFLSFLLMND